MIVKLISLKFSLLLYALLATAEQKTIQTDRFGSVRVSNASNTPLASLIWISERGDFSAIEDDPSFSKSLVAAIDSRAYTAAILADRNDCSYIAGELVRFGQSIQAEEKILTPSLVWLGGEAEGALLAYMAYAQRPQDFLGVLGLNFCPAIKNLPRMCQEGSLVIDEDHNKVLPKADLPFVKLQTAPHCADSNLAATQPKPSLAEVFASHVDASDDHSFHLGTLPLIVTRPEGRPKGRFIFFSGDGGWASIDEELAQKFAAKGYETFGVNSLRYFWQFKNPALIAQELEKLLRELQDGHRNLPIYLIGYSFGADILPHVVAQLTSVAQHQVKKVILLSPEQDALFEVHISEWIGVSEHEGSVPSIKIAQSLTALKPYCLCPSEAEDSLCSVPGACSKIKILPGDHHFDGDYESVTNAVLAWL